MHNVSDNYLVHEELRAVSELMDKLGYDNVFSHQDVLNQSQLILKLANLATQFHTKAWYQKQLDTLVERHRGQLDLSEIIYCMLYDIDKHEEYAEQLNCQRLYFLLLEMRIRSINPNLD